MKKLFIIIFLVAMASVAGADFLAVEKPTTFTSTTTQVDVTGVVTDGICTFGTNAIGDYVRILGVAAFSTGQYTFKARWHDGLGWWSDWSDPYNARKPGASGNARIVEE